MRTWTSLLTLVVFAPVATGCISNEYVIPHEELTRLAGLPPAARGARVHVVQDIGERNAPEIAPPDRFTYVEPVAEADAPEVDALQADGSEADAEPDADVNLDINVGGGDGGGRTARAPAGGRANPTSSGGAGWRGTASPSGSPGWRGTAPASGTGGGHSSGSGGGGHFSLGGGGGGGGGGNIGDAAVLLAVVAVVVAAVVLVGLVGSEGVRFDGLAEMSPAQPVHLKAAPGGFDQIVPLADITPAEAAATVEAKIMDDEGFGIRRLGHVLDRRGLTFKLDLGALAFEPATSTTALAGTTAHIQVGYFFTRSFGVLATGVLSGATDSLGAVLTRHELGLEVQALPFSFGPLHVGSYANGGMAEASTTAAGGALEEGSMFGAGALVEVDLTGRMALTMRAGGDLAHFDDGWSPATTMALGLAIY